MHIITQKVLEDNKHISSKAVACDIAETKKEIATLEIRVAERKKFILFLEALTKARERQQ